ncbi:hypothetical protein EJ110_NYTH19097 [Nymphaea thermarum]|nr:hypothetical protein EJ110_NYTH19097 [Nymphaea thermarum]
MEFLDYKVSPSVSATVSNEKDSQMEAIVRGENEMVSQMEGVTADARDHLFGQVYVRKEKAIVEDVVEEDRTNPNPAISLDDPSPSTKDLPIALRKGTSNVIWCISQTMKSVSEALHCVIKLNCIFCPKGINLLCFLFSGINCSFIFKSLVRLLSFKCLTGDAA